MNSKNQEETYYRLAREAGVLPTRWAYGDVDVQLRPDDEVYEGEPGFQVWSELAEVVTALAGQDKDGEFPVAQYPFLVLVDASEVTDGASLWLAVEEFQNPRQIESQKVLDYVLAQAELDSPADYEALREYVEENGAELLNWLNATALVFKPIRKDTL